MMLDDRFVRYFAVAVVSLLIDLGLMALLLHALRLPELVDRALAPMSSQVDAIQGLQLGALIARAVAVAVATSLAFVLHSRFTFKVDTTQGAGGTYLRYWTVTLSGMLLNLVLFTLLFHGLIACSAWLPSVAARSRSLAALYLAAVVIGGVMLLTNYTANRWWTFRSGAEPRAAPEPAPDTVPGG